jgi:hypothetical protein
MLDGKAIGWILAYTRPVTLRRRYPRREYFAVLPSGRRTDFTLPSRRQAIEWLVQAKETAL